MVDHVLADIILELGNSDSFKTIGGLLEYHLAQKKNKCPEVMCSALFFFRAEREI